MYFSIIVAAELPRVSDCDNKTYNSFLTLNTFIFKSQQHPGGEYKFPFVSSLFIVAGA